MDESLKRKIELYQNLNQSLQNILLQKQALALDKVEMEKALAELENYGKKTVYKSIGVALIEADRDEVISELKDRLEEAKLKLESISRQEEMARKRMEKLKAELEEAGL